MAAPLNSDLARNGEQNGMFGRKHSVESIEKMGLAQLGCKNHMYGKFGKLNPGWDGGNRLLNKLIRGLSEYNIWRKDVYARDNYTCQECGKTNCYIEAHHKVTLKSLIDKYNIKTQQGARDTVELWNLDIGITYCLDCHNRIDLHRHLNNNMEGD